MKHIAYFHVPKCAGTTITDVFAGKFGREAVLTDATFVNYFAVPSTFYDRYKVFAGHITYDCLPLIPRELDFVTVLRNPHTRLLSLYSYYRRIQDDSSQPHSVALAKKLDFHDWLECNNPEVIRETLNSMVRQFVPESFFSADAPACSHNILKAAEDFVSRFSVVGFVEKIDVTREILCSTYAISTGSDGGAARLNSSGSDAVVYSKPRLRRYIEENSWLDLEFVRYCASIFRRQCPEVHRGCLADIEKRVLGIAA